MTIRKRFALWYSGLLTLLIVIFGIAVITVSRLTLLNTIDAVLLSDASNIVNNINIIPVQELTPDTQESIFVVDEDLFLVPDTNIQIWKTYEDGEQVDPVLVRYSASMNNYREPLHAESLYVQDAQYDAANIVNRDLRIVTLPYMNENGQSVGVVQVGMPLYGVMAANDRLLVIALFAAGVVSGLSILVGDWLSGYLLRPIEDVSQAAATVASTDDLSVRLEWKGAEDELGRLTHTFNHMMERLEHLFNIQKHFIGDISHELRTPLTSVIGNIELIEKYGADGNSIDAIHREALRMKQIVDDLLMLSRADAGELSVDMYLLDLDTIIMQAFNAIRKNYPDRNLNFKVEQLEPIRINASSDRLYELIYQLLHNAVQFTADGGTINISLRKSNESAIIEVTDDGMGIEEAEQSRIFERFYQTDSSRARDSEHNGIGLGLPMARWIAGIHGGTIDVESAVGRGSTFRVVLPLTPIDEIQVMNEQQEKKNSTVRITSRQPDNKQS